MKLKFLGVIAIVWIIMLIFGVLFVLWEPLGIAFAIIALSLIFFAPKPKS